MIAGFKELAEGTVVQKKTVPAPLWDIFYKT